MLDVRAGADAEIDLSFAFGRLHDRLSAMERLQRAQARTPMAPIVVVSDAAVTTTNLVIFAKIALPHTVRWELRNINVTPLPAAGAQPAVLTGIETYFLIGNPAAGYDPMSVIDSTNLMPTGGSAWSQGEAPVEPNAQAYAVVVGATQGQVFVMRLQYDQIGIGAIDVHGHAGPGRHGRA